MPTHLDAEEFLEPRVVGVAGEGGGGGLAREIGAEIRGQEERVVA